MDLKILTVILIAIAFLSNITLAIPTWPHVFYGSVTWNGQAAPDGTTVTAKIDGVQVATITTSGGKYGYPVGSFYASDTDPASRSGKTIAFFVNNVNTGVTANFCNGCFNLCGTNTTSCASLDLSATGATEGGGGSTSGGGGGGGGGGTIGGTTGGTTNQTGTTPQVCQEKWVCSDWSTCQDGIQTRTCTDENNCGTRNSEPFTSQPCSAEESKQAEEAQALLPTGFFLGLSTSDWIIGAIVGIVVAAALIFILTRRRSKK